MARVLFIMLTKMQQKVNLQSTFAEKWGVCFI